MRNAAFLAGGVAILLVMSAPAWAAECMDKGEGLAWQKAFPGIYMKTMSLFTCSPNGDAAACNTFVGRAASELYGIEDFRRGNGEYLQANEIMDKVKSTPSWTQLGPADGQGLDKDLMNNAAAGAENHMIIAVRRDQPHGHVALVLPGEPQPSGRWNLIAPNSASAFLGDIDRAYVFCKLSWAFSKTDGLELWWKPKQH